MAITHGHKWVKSENILLDVQLLHTDMIIINNVYKQNAIGDDEDLCNFGCIFDHSLFVTIINYVFL